MVQEFIETGHKGLLVPTVLFRVAGSGREVERMSSENQAVKLNVSQPWH